MATAIGNASELIIELHYMDGDVDMHVVQTEDSAEFALWEPFIFHKSLSEQLSQSVIRQKVSCVVIRPPTEEGRNLQSPLHAAQQALQACRLLVGAYEQGAENGGSMDWSDVDRAYVAAQEALGIPDTGTGEPLPAADGQSDHIASAETHRRE